MGVKAEAMVTMEAMVEVKETVKAKVMEVTVKVTGDARPT